jgi:hypothetical protein
MQINVEVTFETLVALLGVMVGVASKPGVASMYHPFGGEPRRAAGDLEITDMIDVLDEELQRCVTEADGSSAFSLAPGKTS